MVLGCGHWDLCSDCWKDLTNGFKCDKCGIDNDLATEIYIEDYMIF